MLRHAESRPGAYVKYRDVLGEEVREAGRRWGFEPTPSDVRAPADSLRHWEPFPDTVEALRALKERYKLAIISNVDDGLFALTACHLEVEFDWIITAEQAGTYKPSPNNFRVAVERIGVPPDRLLHAAESLFHDVSPAKELGLSTVWVHRRAGKEGSGATPPAEAEPATSRCRISRPSSPRRAWTKAREAPDPSAARSGSRKGSHDGTAR